LGETDEECALRPRAHALPVFRGPEHRGVLLGCELTRRFFEQGIAARIVLLRTSRRAAEQPDRERQPQGHIAVHVKHGNMAMPCFAKQRNMIRRPF
jgi:hypothetical protein